VAVGESAGWLATAELASLETIGGDGEEAGGEAGTGEVADPADEELAHERVFDPQLAVPGAIVATRLASHPLTVGLRAPPPALFHGGTFYRPSGDPQQDLLVVRDEDPVLSGFAFEESRERLSGALLASTQTRAGGRLVLFLQDPAFRLFWRGTMPLLLDALFYGPSLQVGRGPY
jgi:hypothetical protein